MYFIFMKITFCMAMGTMKRLRFRLSLIDSGRGRLMHVRTCINPSGKLCRDSPAPVTTKANDYFSRIFISASSVFTIFNKSLGLSSSSFFSHSLFLKRWPRRLSRIDIPVQFTMQYITVCTCHKIYVYTISFVYVLQWCSRD